MTDQQRAALLREISAVLEIPVPRREDEITIAEAAREWGCSDSTARRRLWQAVESGIMQQRRAVGSNGPCWVFSLVRDE